MKRLVLMSMCIFMLSGCSLNRANILDSKNLSFEKQLGSQTELETTIEKAIKDFYGDKREPILICDEVPFEDGTLVLAVELVDGEKYPELHFVDSNGNITYSTHGSYCWTLNYTEFKGNYIFFGLAGSEVTKHIGQNSSDVKEVEAVFDNKTESVIPEEKIIAHIDNQNKFNNLSQYDKNGFNKSQGYILISKEKKIPNDLTAILKNNDKVSILQNSIECEEDMPDYLNVEKAEVRNSFAFTYTPMLLKEEWEEGHNEGKICLRGKPDKHNNENELFLRPTGNMKETDSFILPQDIKPIYLSYNYTKEAEFSTGETIDMVFPSQRKLVDCRILKLTQEMMDKEVGQDRLGLIEVEKNNKIVLPIEKGYYLFVLRTEKESKIQTYTGMLKIN